VRQETQAVHAIEANVDHAVNGVKHDSANWKSFFE
jgi:hypothetical protein